jgi:translocator assembly and maintenance protein 41
VNLASAVRTALLLLPEEFTELDLFETIAGLSYRGDFRMQVGENPHKVRNIVGAQLESFRSLYGGLLKSFWKSVYVIGARPVDGRTVRVMRQDKSTAQRGLIASKLPGGLKGKVLAYYKRKWALEKALARGAGEEVEDKLDLEAQQLWERIVQDEEFGSIVDKSESIVLIPFPYSR